MAMMDTKTKTFGERLQGAILEIKRKSGQISSNWLDEAPSKVLQRRQLRIILMNWSRFPPD